MSKPSKKTPVPELITLTTAAKRRGVALSTASRAARSALAPAMVGEFLNAAAPEAARWLASKPSRGRKPDPARGVGDVKSDGSAVPTKEQFLRVSFRKREGEALKLELQNRERQGELIERDRVRTHVLGYVDAQNKRLLGDAPKTIASRLYGLAKSNAPLVEGEKSVRDIIASIVRPAREQAVRNLRKKRQRKPEETANESPSGNS